MDKEKFDLLCRNIDEKIKNHRIQTGTLIGYKELASYISDEFIIQLSKTPKRFLNLQMLAAQVVEHYIIYRKLYRLQKYIAPRALSLVYNYSLKKADNFFEKECVRLFPEKYPENPDKPEGVFSPWHNIKIKFSDNLINAVNSDSIPAFEMHRQMSNKRISGSLLGLIFSRKAKNILGHISGTLQKSPLIGGSLDHLLAGITGTFRPDIAVALLEGLESANPGCLKAFRDRWGRNLLWYTISNNWRHPKYKLDTTVIKFLLQKGCDPTEKNVLNQTFLRCSSEEITQKYRASFKSEISQYIKKENP